MLSRGRLIVQGVGWTTEELWSDFRQKQKILSPKRHRPTLELTQAGIRWLPKSFPGVKRSEREIYH